MKKNYAEYVFHLIAKTFFEIYQELNFLGKNHNSTSYRNWESDILILQRFQQK